MEENAIVMSIGRLEGKVDLLITMHSAQTVRADRIEERVGNVEKKVWYTGGVWAALGLLAVKLGVPHMTFA